MIKSSYLKAIGRELGRHAVWEPGTPTEPGDYGMFRDGAFVRLGHLHDLGIGALQIAESHPTPWTFASKGVRTSRMDGGVRAEVVGQVRTRFSFERESSVLVTTPSSLTRHIANLDHTVAALARHRPHAWGMKRALVREVRSVTNACVLVAANAGAAAVVAGEVRVADSMIEDAGSTLEVESSTDSLDAYSGVNGPLLLDIVNVWLLPAGVSVLAAGPADEPYRIEAVDSTPLPDDDAESD